MGPLLVDKPIRRLQGSVPPVSDLHDAIRKGVKIGDRTKVRYTAKKLQSLVFGHPHIVILGEKGCPPGEHINRSRLSRLA